MTRHKKSDLDNGGSGETEKVESVGIEKTESQDPIPIAIQKQIIEECLQAGTLELPGPSSEAKRSLEVGVEIQLGVEKPIELGNRVPIPIVDLEQSDSEAVSNVQAQNNIYKISNKFLQFNVLQPPHPHYDDDIMEIIPIDVELDSCNQIPKTSAPQISVNNNKTEIQFVIDLEDEFSSQRSANLPPTVAKNQEPTDNPTSVPADEPSSTLIVNNTPLTLENVAEKFVRAANYPASSYQPTTEEERESLNLISSLEEQHFDEIMRVLGEHFNDQAAISDPNLPPTEESKKIWNWLEEQTKQVRRENPDSP